MQYKLAFMNILVDDIMILYFFGCVFRWLNTLVVLPFVADTTLEHSSQIICSWLIKLALNPKHFVYLVMVLSVAGAKTCDRQA